MRTSIRVVAAIFSAFVLVVFTALAALGQGSYQAQVRGSVTDQSGAVVVNATVTITNVGTNIAQTAQTDQHGQYFFTGLRPATYTVKAQGTGFRAEEKTGVLLQVDQQTSVDFVLQPQSVSETMEVTTTAPLLDTESATLGSEISNEYVHELPLVNRSFFGLTFLAAGVTEVAGSGTNDNYPSGTNFTSNGQRNATAEIRLDGSLISAPEQGEGGNTNVYYEPLVEGMQEMKVQNNSFSAEFGNNGGTVVNMVMKSGTNAFHGSGWYFLQRSQLDARDFFNPAPNPKPDSKRDQGGFSLGGPIIKNRTFFFVDFEKVASSSASSGVVTVPTLAERQGDFSATATPIYDPTAQGCGTPCINRPQVQYNGNLNVIPPGELNPIGLAVLNLYPKPSNANEFNNYNYSTLSQYPDYQFDIKLDHEINDRNHLSGRYSRGWSNGTSPLTLGDGFDNDGIKSGVTVAQNASLEYTRTFNPRIIWTSHIGVDRVHELSLPSIPTITSFNASLPAGVQGLPSVFQQANGIDKMPTFLMQGNSPWTNLYDQCCINTTFAHTLVSYSSQLVISKGSHLIKIGGEQRIFYNNFWQPNYPSGFITFTDNTTSPTPNSDTDASGNPTGNPFASLAFGYGDNINASSQLVVTPSVANRSLETGFYVQDDWRVNSKLTLNLGLRYQWSSPYTSRGNQIEFSNFAADSGVNIPLNSVPGTAPAGTLSTQAMMQSAGLNYPASQEVLGTTQFPTSSMRTVPTYWKDVGPRLGFSYQLDPQTVVRGGAGIYFGMSPATNFQYPGSAFRKTANLFFTNDNFATQSATLENPFPGGFTGPQGKQYGQFASWGYQNQNDLGTTAARDANIYQWNLGIERLLPSQIVLGVDYSANRSTHLPWAGTNNRSFIPSALLAQITAAVTPTDSNCIGDSCVSNFLQTNVGNPFYSMFNTPCTSTASHPCFNEPNSNYGQTTLPLGTLLNQYPQFAGDFEGLMIEEASSWYNALQIRFQKRTTHHISFEGSYTISKETDDSSAGRNNWVGALGAGIPQQLDRLYAEHSIGANDTPQRLAAAVVVDLPIGRKQWIGGNMNRAVDAVVGGWSLATIITEQSGQPMALGMSNARLANGTQRPDVVCSQLKTGVSMHSAALSWQNATPAAFLNANCFADPGDQVPGNAPRYFPGLRVDGIHNMDLNIYKSFVPKEGMRIEVRAETFNTLNHPRFGQPNSAVGDPLFGTVTSDAPGESPRSFQFGLRFEF
ncbi:MAG TPA: carboxypeptidase regulatory-like domain-containing protein [Candidatus Sulfotelmatobacter sp.]|nr:carboxypeptidase regulatory-like domain-containing protein [Candidatus Sulfotelmatobacter sp.]